MHACLGAQVQSECRANCRAAIFRRQCKHRINLAVGDTTKVVDGADQLDDLTSILQGSDVAALIDKFLVADLELEDAKRARKDAAEDLVQGQCQSKIA
jgi:hypothetical protein